MVGEFDDAAMAQAFGKQAAGVFTAPAVIRQEVCEQYGVECLGTIPVEESLYAVTAQRRLSHPAMDAVLAAARQLFRPPSDS